MNEQNKPLPQQSEEVDLGQLFKIIGKGFQNLFNFIGSIFKAIFKGIILFLKHIYKSAKWYGIALGLGLALGFGLEKTTKTPYGANMFIETNFDSSRKVYEVMTELHQLTRSKEDNALLAKRLSITPEEATSITGFYIKPDENDSQLMQDFIEYKKGLDSVSREEITFDYFKKTRPIYAFKIHQIGVTSTDKSIFKKINDGLLSNFTDNPYINSLRNATLQNLDKQEAAINSEIKTLDSLLVTYLGIRKRQSEKEVTASQGTNFYMGNAERSELIKDETEIVNRISKLQASKEQITLKRVNNQQLVNVISGFPDTGYNIRKWFEKKPIILPVVFVSLMLLYFALAGLGKFVKAYNA